MAAEKSTKKAVTKTAKVTVATATAPATKPSLPKTLDTLQFLRTAKGKSDAEIHKMLDAALVECTKADMTVLLEKIMMHIGDVSRQHNVLRSAGILSEKGGAQEREIFRSIMRWWDKKLPTSFAKNIPLFAEYTVYENLIFAQITTDRAKGTVLKQEFLMPAQDKVQDFLASQIRKGKDVNLIAKHLPKFDSAKSRTTTKVIKAKRGINSFEWTLPVGKAWVKVNNKLVSGTKVTLNAGDVVSYPRDKQQATLEKQKVVNKWITELCSKLDWSINDYKEFRKKQNTPEQLFSSKRVDLLSIAEFTQLLDGLTSGQRFRVAKMVAYKDAAGNLQPKTKWPELGKAYIAWEKNQEAVAQKIRNAVESGDETARKDALKEFKVKAIGVQTIDLLAELLKGGLTKGQIDNTYQAMIEKMDMIGTVFPIIDGSGSMGSSVNHKGVNCSYFDIVCAMAVAFSTRNPEPKFQNTFGWFSNTFKICGKSQYVIDAPNPFVAKAEFTKKLAHNVEVLSATKGFSDNFKALKNSNPGEVANTNMFSSVEYFVKLVQDGFCSAEELPNALLFLTDGENNSGRSPKEAIQLANSIGWRPLIIYWGIQSLPYTLKDQKIPNCLWVSGFNEGALSQILRGIKGGTVNPEDELWAIYEDKRYSLVN